LEEFKYEKATIFEEMFCPSDNMLDDEQANYYAEAITDKFVFVGCSFAESVDVIFQDDEGNWKHASPEEQSIRILASTDSSGLICSFKGVSYYPFKFEKGEADIVSYLFTEEAIEITAPRKLLTVSYNGRVDIFKCYIKDLPSIKDNEPGKAAPPIVEKAPIAAPSKTAFSSMFGNMGIGEKASFLNEKQEPKKSKIDSSWGESKKSMFSQPAENTKTSIFGNKMSLPKESKDPLPSKSDSESQKIIKIDDNSSPVKNYDAQTRKEKIIEKYTRELAKPEAPKAVVPNKAQNSISAEENDERIEIAEKQFLERVEDSFSKLFLQTQFSLANDINKPFAEFSNLKKESMSLLTAKESNCSSLKDRLIAYTLGNVRQQHDLAELVDSTKKNFETNEKIQNYWSNVKHNDEQSHHQTRSMLGENDLFTRKIEDTIQKGEAILENSFKFVHIIRGLTQQARKLNENFSKAKVLKFKGGFNDPLLQKYKNSGVMSRLMKTENPKIKEWKKVGEKLKNNQLDEKDLNKKIKVYSTFVDELAENDGYLCKILDQNLVKMILKMKNYEEFNDTLNDEDERDGDIYYKYDFTKEVNGPQLQISSKLLLLNFIIVNKRQETQSAGVNMNYTPVRNFNNDKGLIEVKNPLELHTKFENKISGTRKTEITKIKLEVTKKHVLEDNKYESSSDCSEKEDSKSLKKSANPISDTQKQNSIFKNKESQKVKKDTAQKVGTIAQDDISFGDGSENSDIGSDEFDDQVSEMRPHGMIKLRKIQTAIPENMDQD